MEKSEWQPIETAAKDGSTVLVRRLYEGEVIYQGPAAWRTVRFGALFDPINGERFAEQEDATGWMYPDKEFRVPEPTHWRPA